MAVRPDSTMGYRTGSKLFLIFMFGFFLLRYSLFLSICLAAIGALAGGFLSSWWHAKEDYITDEATESTIVESESVSPLTVQPHANRYGFGVRRARGGPIARPARGFGWLFRRNR